jgi:hypothetical protein
VQATSAPPTVFTRFVEQHHKQRWFLKEIARKES